MTAERLNLVLAVGAAVLLVAVAAVRLSSRTGLPSLLVYLALGIGLGESGLGLRFDDVVLTRVLGTCALVLILAEGGLTTRWPVVRAAVPAATVLSTLGVGISVVVIAAVAHYTFGMDWRLALLAGSVISSTDAAAVFSTFRRLRLPRRLVAILEVESGVNDAPAVLLVVLLTTGSLGSAGVLGALGLIGYELVAGAAVGLAAGFVGAWVLRRSALPAAGLYPLAAVAFTVLAYGAAGILHASGFLAVYVAGVVLGNSRLPHRRAMLGFADGIAWLAQIGLFVLLGLLVSPTSLLSAIVPALGIGAVLLVVARPLSVLASVSWFGIGLREQLFLSWAGLRGAVPIVLATIPLSAGVPGSRALFDMIFVLVVVFTVIQGTTLPPVARILGVASESAPTEVRVESAPLETMDADLLQLRIPAGSRLNGVYIDELRLPAGASVTLVVREGKAFVPGGETRLRAGDDLLLVATSECREAAERRLRAVGRRGRLAKWFGETGEERRA
ncbi:MAG: potassium/hydrogen antiporter [Cryptosporangiaceae bacterium]|nr:potassium/hydrogen antiporter [Cryptosporangiaceae bacterium]